MIPKGGWRGVACKGGVAVLWMECGQGFLWSLLYGNSQGTANATAALVIEAHKTFPSALPNGAKLIDRCEFNYQREAVELGKRKCKKAFKCTDVVFLHKFHDQKAVEQHGDAHGVDVICTKPDHRPVRGGVTSAP